MSSHTSEGLFTPVEITVLGRVIDPSSPNHMNTFGHAAKKFPNLASCLHKTEKSDRVNSEHLPIDWHKFRNDFEVLTCLMALVKYMGSPEHLTSWASANDFTVDRFIVDSPSGGYRLVFHFEEKEYEESSLYQILRRMFLYYFNWNYLIIYNGFNVIYDAEERLFDVSLN